MPKNYPQKEFLKIAAGIVVILIVAALSIMSKKKDAEMIPTEPVIVDTITPPAETPVPIVTREELYTGAYYPLTLTTTAPLTELTKVVGETNVAMVLTLNRIDSKFLKQNSVVIVPKDPSNTEALSPFPPILPLAQTIPKLLFVSQRIQAFGVYESGVLMRWGAISTGKKSTPTTSKLYFTNWKGKEVHSSFSDEWVLKWNFNLDNFEGIGMHQYEMPGFPASHSCIRMFEADAKWLYDWADQWIVSADQQTLVAHGTPVIVFGDYAYDKTAPWKTLPENASATTLSVTELETVLTPSIDAIAQALQERITATTTPVL